MLPFDLEPGRLGGHVIALAELPQENLLEAVSLGLRKEKVHQHGTDESHGAEKPAHAREVVSLPQDVEQPGDDQHTDPVECSSSAQVDATVPAGHQLGSQDPHHGTEANRVAYNVPVYKAYEQSPAIVTTGSTRGRMSRAAVKAGSKSVIRRLLSTIFVKTPPIFHYDTFNSTKQRGISLQIERTYCKRSSHLKFFVCV